MAPIADSSMDKSSPALVRRCHCRLQRQAEEHGWQLFPTCRV